MLKLSDWQKNEKLFSFWGGEKLPFADVASCVGPGWSALLEDLCNKLLRLGWDGGLSQVKEKFGSLRFYWNNNITDPTIAAIAEDVVCEAENQSWQICENCGDMGKIRRKGPGGWMACRCIKCAKQEGYPLESWEENYVEQNQKGAGATDGPPDGGAESRDVEREAGSGEPS